MCIRDSFLTQKASANFNLREVPGVLKAENYGFAIRKGDDKLRARLDTVSYTHLCKRWTYSLFLKKR